MPARILTIEDNAQNLELIAYLLEAFGHTTYLARDGEEGLEAVKREVPDLVICDIQLPKMDGLEVLRRLRSDPSVSKIPVVAITALAMAGDREKMLAAGFDGYIPKPINPETFVKELEPFFVTSEGKRSTPPSHEHAQSPLPAPAHVSRLPEDQRTILVVDDRPINRQFLVSLLEPFGFRLREAGNGADALRLLEREVPDLIVTDVCMPRIGGADFVRFLRSYRRMAKVPVIFYTGTVEPSEKRRLEQLPGVVVVLIKPTPAETIVRVVHEALRLPVPAGSGEQAVEDDSYRMVELMEASLECAAERDPRALLEAVCRKACRLTGAACGAVGGLAKDGNSVRYFSATGFGRQSAESGVMALPKTPIMRTLLGERRPARKRVVSADQLMGILFREPPDSSEIRGFLAVPLASASKCYGWLALGSKPSGDEFSIGEERMVLTLAAMASMAYENALLYQELQHRAEDLERKA